ncbi:U32 family peptidase [Hydrogeniiclostridium mannosilyticum]|uniref:U32 family peptidase n=1 Tax=Hydrogeniiclostridium mannosilyticum TaxID=2764322 RepID=UPI00399BDC80
MEILAPAGSPESLTAAVRAGADAVYLGASSFSARANAHNFDNEALAEAVRYCHAYGVKVYLAVNTVLRDEELPAALELVAYACQLPVDAVLVQDMGLFRLIGRAAPGLPLHASTQMSIHTPAGARALQQAGATRVVLSRELSLREMKGIAANASVELEAFVHGALCMSVSGQCYFSAMLGSRSGNRGLCAQPCRLPFQAEGGTGHDLSLKDLSMVERVRELEAAGICCAKIEGRMKRPEYVAAAVSACRHAVDEGAPPPALLNSLRAVFSRSGFTTGYPDGRLGREMFGTRQKEDVAAATNQVLSGLRGLYKSERRRVPVHFFLDIHRGLPSRLIVRDAEGYEAAVEGEIPQPALNRPLDAAFCEKQLGKTGGTPFLPAEYTCKIDEGLSLPIPMLNGLRREALKRLETARRQRPPVSFHAPVLLAQEHASSPPRPVPARLPLRGRFPDDSLPDAARALEWCYLPYTLPSERFQTLTAAGYRIALELPRGLFGLEDAVAAQLTRLWQAGARDVWAGNIGAAQLAKELGFTVHGGFSLNLLNGEALAWYREFGLADAELSFELTLRQAAAIGDTLKRGLLLYGHLPLMLTRNCPAANGPGGCRHCKVAGKTAVLTDRRGAAFPVQCFGACSEVLNTVPLEMSDRLAEVQNLDFGVLRFTVEAPAARAAVIQRYLTAQPPEKEYTRGLYYRGIE